MRAFVLRQNIAHFERLLAKEQDAGQRQTLNTLLVEARRELATLHEADPPDPPPRKP